MTSKTFKSAVSDLELCVIRSDEGNMRVLVDSCARNHAAIDLAPSDSPAVMLAIGEATGVEPALEMYSKYGTPEHMAHIQWHLHEYVKAQEATAVAEADRVKLEAEALKLLNELRGVDGVIPFYDWTQVSEVGKKRWLAVARAARELNKETGQ